MFAVRTTLIFYLININNKYIEEGGGIRQRGWREMAGEVWRIMRRMRVMRADVFIINRLPLHSSALNACRLEAKMRAAWPDYCSYSGFRNEIPATVRFLTLFMDLASLDTTYPWVRSRLANHLASTDFPLHLA